MWFEGGERQSLAQALKPQMAKGPKPLALTQSGFICFCLDFHRRNYWKMGMSMTIFLFLSFRDMTVCDFDMSFVLFVDNRMLLKGRKKKAHGNCAVTQKECSSVHAL